MPPETTTTTRPSRTESAPKPAEKPAESDDGTLTRVFLAIGVLTTVAWGIALIALAIWAISAL